MSKKIPVEQLTPGMYIADLGAGWMDHPFLRSSFAVSDEATVAKIIGCGLREVYIDPSRGLDVAGAPTKVEVDEKLDKEMERIAEEEPAPIRKVSYQEEAGRAKEVHTQANVIIHGMLQDVRLGKQVKVEQVEPVVAQITESILRNGGALLSLCRIKDKDNYTFQHSVSVGTLLIAFCRAMDMSAEEIRLAGVGGLLHDIGKMKVPDDILNSPNKLSDDEFRTMKDHVTQSKLILDKTDGVSLASIQVAYQHHERHDGTGYPNGLKGDGISQLGKMAAIVDVYDAITADRCYHKGLPAHEALRKLFEWSKFHFDPLLVQHFMRAVGIYPVGTLVMLESGRIGLVMEQTEGNLLQPVIRVFFDSRGKLYITPREVDLSKPEGHGGADKIVSSETPEKWGIDVSKFM
ncbi:MAG: HD-GYP domain-containing protein [Rhodocyclaceae bacterium]|nr:HD-GYP domain-containing protein [Rhodocyclaceae bacterium]